MEKLTEEKKEAMHAYINKITYNVRKKEMARRQKRKFLKMTINKTFSKEKVEEERMKKEEVQEIKSRADAAKWANKAMGETVDKLLEEIESLNKQVANLESEQEKEVEDRDRLYSDFYWRMTCCIKGHSQDYPDDLAGQKRCKRLIQIRKLLNEEMRHQGMDIPGPVHSLE